ncbi:hypothetical protein EYR38_007123 [Pleurotus pulmonarius]|nr:hypothetical protein EYR38_007123 [Pleurotus pulmonarius]
MASADTDTTTISPQTEGAPPHPQVSTEDETQNGTDVDDCAPQALLSGEAENQTLVQAASGEYVYHLRPPINTVFYKEDLVTVFDKEAIYSRVTGRGKVGSITWRANIYTYVLGARPDRPDFEKLNGSILIVIVHSGTVRIDLGSGWSLSCAQEVRCPTHVVPKVHLPPSNSGTHNGERWDYKIAFDESLPMFNNAGNGTFEFLARYERGFSVQSGKQVEEEVDDGWKFTGEYSSGSNVNHTIAGLSVFTTKVPQSSFDFTFRSCPKGSALIIVDELTRHEKTIKVHVNLKVMK